MKTYHQVLLEDARDLSRIADDSVELVVTSPPYPMIEMWDAMFAGMNPTIAAALSAGDGSRAFELMHQELDEVWAECFRVLRPGCIACVNIGDAVRTVADDFQLYANHARVVSSMCRAGFSPLPDVLWRKQTNAPNKFMGSGMLPAGAYVTYEHEYVLIFRKGGRRAFTSAADRRNRRASAFFWEERNAWFSDVWTDLKGTTQELADQAARERRAAYPLELAFRLICMHSVYGDTVLDPFLGTGTTIAAAVAAGRNSIGVEIDDGLRRAIWNAVEKAVPAGADRVASRLGAHRAFVRKRTEAGGTWKHHNAHHGFPVTTAQETDIVLHRPARLRAPISGRFEVEYEAAGVC